MEDLDSEALDLRPKGLPDQSMSLNNLAVNLSTRYEQLGIMEDLNEAIVLGREALNFRPKGHPDRFTALDNLVRRLYDQFARTKQSKDKKELFSLYAQLIHFPSDVSSNDLSVARAWIRVAEDSQHPTIVLALRLLIQHVTILPSLPQHLTILKNLTSSLAVDTF
ncbi:hypothetical protein L210DRAFT_3538988 [Boletus edulis BED1]|uniref:Uncharacterized protein n=1 Tax=Boletus edulis BED1 TaxID=1328754 RepID=A0AAD4BVI8_BOLED|nr:hypothetical protein L210DRAFT_3538988 [Boletus edulis BED1]